MFSKKQKSSWARNGYKFIESYHSKLVLGEFFCSEERWCLRAYGSKYSTKAKECDVKTVQKPLEDTFKEMHLFSQTVRSVYPYLQRNTERDGGGEKNTFQVTEINKFDGTRNPGEIHINDN